MSIIHVNQIRKTITTLFDGKIDITDVSSSASIKDRDNNFFTRGLAAYAIYYLAHASVEVCANSIVDGGNDNGIDAIFFDERDKRFYIIQSKWINDGKGEPDNGSVKKFVAGIKDLFNLRFDRFNTKIQVKGNDITKALDDTNTRFEVVLVYTGINQLASPSKRDLIDLSEEMNDTSEVLSVRILNQTDLYKSLTAGILGEPINLTIGIKAWGKVQTPQEAYYGQVDGLQISNWWETYQTRLFAKNLRGILGDTEVNNEIRNTIVNFPQFFWYYNNGITLLCKNISKTMTGGGDKDYGTFVCNDISIVNGAQTVGTIGKYHENNNENLGKLHVQIRIISLAEGNESFGENITKTNNRQNRIENRDFVSLDPEQARIQLELAIEKINYQFIRSDAVQRTQDSFDLVESTTALACASGDTDLTVQLKREIGKLWENTDRAPYKEIFNSQTSGMYVWRCVRIQRIIDDELERIRERIGINSGRNYGIAVHGNRMISSMVFSHYHAKKFSNPDFNFEQLLEGQAIIQDVNDYYNKLVEQVEILYSGAIIPTLFKNLRKCRILMDACIQ